MSVTVRRAERWDASEIRSLVTRALLTAGLAPPSTDLDHDLMDLGYYAARGRAIWVAERDGIVVGCAAVDASAMDLGGAGVLRRLAGGALDHLLETALDFARAEDLPALETVLPPGLPGTREALLHVGFQPVPGASDLLLRREL